MSDKTSTEHAEKLLGRALKQQERSRSEALDDLSRLREEIATQEKIVADIDASIASIERALEALAHAAAEHREPAEA